MSDRVPTTRLQDELIAKRELQAPRRGGLGGMGGDDRYAQILQSIISQVASLKMSPAETLMIKLVALAATSGIEDQQKRSGMQSLINSAVQIRAT